MNTVLILNIFEVGNVENENGFYLNKDEELSIN